MVRLNQAWEESMFGDGDGCRVQPGLRPLLAGCAVAEFTGLFGEGTFSGGAIDCLSALVQGGREAERDLGED